VKHYKLAVLTAVMTTLAAAHAKNTDNNSPATISIMDYANKNTLDGTAAKQFVFMRCAAL
jgi:hypothetical protein